MRYLAIDPGDKRTGLAVGDDVTRIATPLEVIMTSSPEVRLQAIRKAIEQHGPDALIVGVPLNMDGSSGPAASQARRFIGELRKRFNLPVHGIDERLSSVDADDLMSRSGLTHKGKKVRRDALAAAVLLQRFFSR